MMTMTNEIREKIEALMNEVCGGKWYDTTMTEEICNKVCEACPYRGKCWELGIMWGCPNWEESMGEDL